VKCVTFVSETFTRYGSNKTNLWQKIYLAPLALPFSREVVHEKLWKSVNVCKSYSNKISGTFFSGHGVYLLNWYCARRLSSEFPDKGWKLGSIDSLLKPEVSARRVQLHGKQPQATADRVWRVATITHVVEELVLSQDKPIKTHRNFVQFRVKLPFTCARGNSPRSLAQMLQTTSCSAVIWILKPIVSPISVADMYVVTCFYWDTVCIWVRNSSSSRRRRIGLRSVCNKIFLSFFCKP